MAAMTTSMSTRSAGEFRAASGPLLQQAWERYRIPVAITEAHLGCTREEQLRWLHEVWRGSCDARRRGIDVLAVTAWSAFGAYDWDSLVTRDLGHYEPGLFDARWSPPKPTALAALVREIASGGEPDHPALDAPGWWHRPERFLFGDAESAAMDELTESVPRPRTLLITGASGTLARAFARICQWRGLPHVLLCRTELDIADSESVALALKLHRPWAVINAAGYTRIDGAETEPERCMRENAAGPAILAGECAARKIALVSFSSDFVFDGRQDRPYREGDIVGPVNVYGTSKAEAEREVLVRHPEALIIRTSAFFSPWDERNFVARALAALRGGRLFAAPDDLTLTPSYVPDLVGATLDLLIDREGGIWHLSNPEPVTWAELARQVGTRSGFDERHVIGKPAAAFGLIAPRPAFSALTSDRGPLLPPLANALDRYFRDIELRI